MCIFCDVLQPHASARVSNGPIRAGSQPPLVEVCPARRTDAGAMFLEGVRGESLPLKGRLTSHRADWPEVYAHTNALRRRRGCHRSTCRGKRSCCLVVDVPAKWWGFRAPSVMVFQMLCKTCPKMQMDATGFERPPAQETWTCARRSKSSVLRLLL